MELIGAINQLQNEGNILPSVALRIDGQVHTIQTHQIPSLYKSMGVKDYAWDDNHKIWVFDLNGKSEISEPPHQSNDRVEDEAKAKGIINWGNLKDLLTDLTLWKRLGMLYLAINITMMCILFFWLKGARKSIKPTWDWVHRNWGTTKQKEKKENE